MTKGRRRRRRNADTPLCYWVYLLFSPSTGIVYCGFTANLRRRFRQHNSPRNRGYTRRGRPWRLLAARAFADRNEALAFERRIKRTKFAKRNWIRRRRKRLEKLRQSDRLPPAWDATTESPV
jgi:predicted GIY-YIG superfamily endonuclease